MTPKGLSKAIKTASKPFKGGKTTEIARALEKHADPIKRPNYKLWGNASGTPLEKHQKAMKHFNEILKGPGEFKKVPVSNKPGRFFLEKRLSDRRGIRLNEDHTFKGFIG